MKNCIRIPRVYLPWKDFQAWSFDPCAMTDEADWVRVAAKCGSAPSLLYAFAAGRLGEETGEEKGNAYLARLLRDDSIHKLNRGFVLVERECRGGVLRGIVLALDLEAYGTDKDACLRPTQESAEEEVQAALSLRRNALLEFPQTRVFYRDKRNKIAQLLAEEELERVYDFDLMQEGGRICGYYIPEDLSVELTHMLMSRADPCFFLAGGDAGILAARRHWDALKTTLPEEERRFHPARFALAEMINFCDGLLTLQPVHRFVRGASAEELYALFSREFRCRREEGAIVPQSDAMHLPARTDALLARYVQECGGEVICCGEEEFASRLARGEGAGIKLCAPKPDELLAAVKAGKLFPARTFTVGTDRERRYCLEGREISYD